MDDTSSKTELITPFVLKAGVPLAALSLAALIYAGIIVKKSLSTASPSRARIDSSEKNDSQQGVKPDESNQCLEREISGLKSQIEDLQKRESDLRQQFDRYCEMKERESLLMQVMNLLSQETARVELLEKELSFMEAENSKLKGFLVQYVRIIEQLDGWKSQNRLLRGRLKKLQRKSNAQTRLTNKQALKIKASEAEILENRNALHTRIDVISQIKNEVRELHSVLEQLQNEKNELLKKLDEAEKSCASKVEELDASKEEYKQLQKEMEELKKQRDDAVNEVARLRYIDPCQKRQQEKKNQTTACSGVTGDETERDLDDDSVIDQTMACFGGVPSDDVRSKKNKLMRRLKGWVGGSDKARVSPLSVEKDSHESHTATRGADKTPLPA